MNKPITILETRCLVSTLILYFSEDELNAATDAVLDKDLSQEARRLPLVIRIRRTCDAVINVGKHLNDLHEDLAAYTVPV